MHPGVTLVRNAGRSTLRIDLCAAGVAVRTTRYAERGQRPGTWATSVGLAAAVNGDFFNYPAGCGTGCVVSRARGAGEDWPASAQMHEAGRGYWQFGPGVAGFVADNAIGPAAGATDLVGGHDVVVSAGQAVDLPSDSFYDAHRPRTGVGLSADGRVLYLLSTTSGIRVETVGTYLLADALQAGGPPVHVGTNEDGGGSAQMFVQGLGYLSSGDGRVVANHVGVYATGSGAAPNCPPQPCDARVGHFGWNCSGPMAGLTCTRVDEPSDPDSWADNYFCADGDVGVRWSSAGPITGMRCTPITESSEPEAHTWNDNFVCVPPDSPFRFEWSSAGPIAGKSCIPWREPSDPHTWFDNFLCWSEDRPSGSDAGPVQRPDGGAGNAPEAGSARDASSADASSNPDGRTEQGCGCRTTPRPAQGALSPWFAVVVAMVVRRRKTTAV